MLDKDVFAGVYSKSGTRDPGLLVGPETWDPSHRWDLGPGAETLRP